MTTKNKRTQLGTSSMNSKSCYQNEVCLSDGGAVSNLGFLELIQSDCSISHSIGHCLDLKLHHAVAYCSPELPTYHAHGTQRRNVSYNVGNEHWKKSLPINCIT